jgi:hypothetical protein
MTDSGMSGTSEMQDRATKMNIMHRMGKPKSGIVVNERRTKVHLMLCQGLNETEIAARLNVNQSTISRDSNAIKKISQQTIRDITAKTLPYEFVKSLESLKQITRKCYQISEDQSGSWTNKDKLNALKLLRETERTKVEILMLGPVNLRAQQLEQKIKDLVEEQEAPRKSYFTAGSPPNAYDDLR